MTPIAIQDDLLESIRKVAEQQGSDVEQLVNDWLRRELALLRERTIAEEAERFRSQHVALLAQYPGEYVALRDGVVLDHGPEINDVYLRIKSGYGDEPILIALVTPQPERQLRVRRPRIIRSAV